MFVPELLEYKCPACGGAINFDSSIQKMKCPYCETEFEMETLKALDECLNDDFTDEMVWETQGGTEWNEDETAHINSYICKSCAGEIVADENTAATSCPFCDNPVVMTGKLSGALRPDYVIPFKLDKKAAKEGLMKHLKGKILLPKIFKDENRIEEIKGIYVPFWLFNADADANIRYRATKVRYWSDSNYNYTETRHYLIMRSGSIGYERVPVDGSKKFLMICWNPLNPIISTMRWISRQHTWPDTWLTNMMLRQLIVLTAPTGVSDTVPKNLCLHCKRLYNSYT